MINQLVFFGSSPFSVPVLEKIIASNRFQNISVITTSDKPTGRGLKLTPNPVKLLAQKHNLPVTESHTNIQTNQNTIGLVAAYGKIIPQSVLDMFNGQIFNIHPSLLPKYRGASPLQQQILDAVVDTGVTIIQIDDQMDHGPILAQQPDKILETDTWISLGERLFSTGTDIFINLRDELGIRHEQEHDKATYTKKLTRQDGFVSWEEFNQPEKLNNKFRAFYSWPGVWTTNPAGKRVKLISINPLKTQEEGQAI